MMLPEELFSALGKLSDKELFAHSFHPYEYQYIAIRPSRLKSCGSTADAVMKSIFGSSANTKMIALSDLELDVLRARVCLFSSEICTYRVSFVGKTQSPGSSESKNIDHHVCIVMYKDKHNEVRYRFIQSYLHNYSLSEYMAKSRHGLVKSDFSHDDFIEFIGKLNQFSMAKVWSDEIEAFYLQYFDVKTTRTGAEICITHADGHTFEFNITRSCCSLNKIEIKTPKDADYILFNGWDNESEKNLLRLKAIQILCNVGSCSLTDPGFLMTIEVSPGNLEGKYVDVKYKPMLDALVSLQKPSANIEEDVLTARSRLEKAIDNVSVSPAKTEHLVTSAYKPAGSVDSTTSKDKQKSTMNFF